MCTLITDNFAGNDDGSGHIYDSPKTSTVFEPVYETVENNIMLEIIEMEPNEAYVSRNMQQ